MTTPGEPAADTPDERDTPDEPPADVVVDARGLRCPLPVIRLAQAARDSPAGLVIDVWSTDHAAPGDIAAWCRMRGHTLVGGHERPDGTATTRVRLVAPAPGDLRTVT